MSLIKCPECGEEISSSADRCIHCGAEFSVCPDCGQIYIGKPDACGNCGYAFVTKKAENERTSTHPNPAVQSQLELYNVTGAWRAASPFNAKLSKYVKIACTVFTIAALVFFVLAVYLTFDKSQKLSSNNFGDLLNSVNDFLNGKNPVKSLMSSINTLLVFAILFFMLISILPTLSEIYELLSIESMIKTYISDKGRIIEFYKNKTSHKLTQDNDMDFDSVEVANVGTMYLSVYFSDVRQGKIHYFIYCGVLFLLTIASGICLGIGLYQNAEAYLASKISGSPFEFQYIILIVFAVFCVASKIWSNFAIKPIAKKAVEYGNALCSEE